MTCRYDSFLVNHKLCRTSSFQNENILENVCDGLLTSSYLRVSFTSLTPACFLHEFLVASLSYCAKTVYAITATFTIFVAHWQVRLDLCLLNKYMTVAYLSLTLPVLQEASGSCFSILKITINSNHVTNLNMWDLGYLLRQRLIFSVTMDSSFLQFLQMLTLMTGFRSDTRDKCIFLLSFTSLAGSFIPA